MAETGWSPFPTNKKQGTQRFLCSGAPQDPSQFQEDTDPAPQQIQMSMDRLFIIGTYDNWLGIWNNWICWQKSLQISSIVVQFYLGQNEDCSLETPQMTLRKCSKEVGGDGQYIWFWWRGSSMQSSAYFTKDFLPVTKRWCHHLEI